MKHVSPVPAGEIFRLTIPQLGLMLCHLFMSMTSIWVAGQLDSRVLASLGFIAQLSTLLMLLISLVGSGCMATVSQSLGAGLKLRATRYSGLIVGLSFLAGCTASALGLAALPLALHTGLVPGDIAPMARVFGTAHALQIPFFYCMVMLNSVFRAHKLVWLPFGTLALTAAANFAGSVGLGLGHWGLPQWGYTAVAWSSFFSTLLGLVSNVVLGLRTGILCRASFAPWRWNRVAAPRLWRIGAPMALGNLVTHVGSVVLLACVARVPQDAVAAVAGMTLGGRITGFLLFPLSALGMTVTILSGHLLGARQPHAARALGKRCAFRAACATALAALAVALLREPLAALFDPNAETVRQATLFLLFACATLPLQAVTQILHAVLAGAGATRFLCRIGCISTWLVAVPLALLGHWAAWGASGVYAAMTAGHVCGTVLTLRVFFLKRVGRQTGLFAPEDLPCGRTS